MTWLAEVDAAPVVPLVCVHYDNLITKAVLDKNEDFKDFVNKASKVRVCVCVCERERERDRESVCARICVCARE